MATKTKTEIDPARIAFGLRLADARKKKELTQDQVAVRFSMNKASVSAWETGRGDPGVFRLFELCRLYGCSSAYLMGETVSSANSDDAMKIAAHFDALPEEQRVAFKALWVGFSAGSATQKPTKSIENLHEQRRNKQIETQVDLAKKTKATAKH